VSFIDKYLSKSNLKNRTNEQNKTIINLIFSFFLAPSFFIEQQEDGLLSV